MLSGFTPAMSSIEENCYSVFGTADSFTFSVEQTNLVFNIQPAPVMVYDYYEKGRQATAVP
ncbi:Ovostatin 1 [Saguinus oedipus]|uniref:Ovostatin 1 n=1 Tax=Saguinus oedipus TaxID=9490 RepID=A0ABQ9UWW6_SAGOE|nr:Ovostatin 1 [Saguinus oedipus]